MLAYAAKPAHSGHPVVAMGFCGPRNTAVGALYATFRHSSLTVTSSQTERQSWGLMWL
jgi:hypothetical protein